MKPRAERLSELLPDAGVDVLLVTELVNVRYLTGYTGSNGLALVGRRRRRSSPTSAMSSRPPQRWTTRSSANAPHRDLLEAVPDIAARESPAARLRGRARVRSRARQAQARSSRIRVELVGASGLVESLRAVKEPGEIEQIRAAVALADESFEQILSAGLVGRTEREIAIAIEHDMRMRRGAAAELRDDRRERARTERFPTRSRAT